MAVNRDIKYINKDFSQFRNQLINYSKTYFPTTYTDFTPTSPVGNKDILTPMRLINICKIDCFPQGS